MAKVFIYNNNKDAKNYVAILERLNTSYILSQDITAVNGCSHLLLCGGGDVHPAFYCQENVCSKNIDVIRDLKEFYLINYFFTKGLPILGICRGMQIINVFFGGSLRQSISDKNLHYLKNNDCYHFITTVNNLLEKNYFNQLLVNSSHRQCVDKIGKNLTPTLFSDDIICEGFAHKNNKILAVQFHPERLKTNPECIYKYFISLK